jgi:O-antigen biosynthesis protein WbqP
MTSADVLVKRIFDLTLALLLVLPISVVSLPIAAAIWWQDRSSPFFVQYRVGRSGRPFRLLKFRTMSPRAPSVPSHLASSDLITPLGRFLRRTKLDELPQIWNILVGQMSFVGPRPCLPEQHELIRARAAYGVLELLPGITGPSQIIGLDMSQPQGLAQHDSLYCRAWSLRRDLQILFRTLVGSGRGDAVR